MPCSDVLSSFTFVDFLLRFFCLQSNTLHESDVDEQDRHKDLSRSIVVLYQDAAWPLSRLSASASTVWQVLMCGQLRREDSSGRSPSVVHADAFGAAGAGGTLTYYLATAFDKVSCSRCNVICCLHALLAHIRQPAAHLCKQDLCNSRAMHLQVYMQPSGLLSISGLASSTPFLRDFFAQWKVRPFFVAREEYKNVANQFTQVCGNCSPFLLTRGDTHGSLPH